MTPAPEDQVYCVIPTTGTKSSKRLVRERGVPGHHRQNRAGAVVNNDRVKARMQPLLGREAGCLNVRTQSKRPDGAAMYLPKVEPRLRANLESKFLLYVSDGDNRLCNWCRETARAAGPRSDQGSVPRATLSWRPCVYRKNSRVFCFD